MKTQKRTQVFSGLEIQARYRKGSRQTGHYTSDCENCKVFINRSVQGVNNS